MICTSLAILSHCGYEIGLNRYYHLITSRAILFHCGYEIGLNRYCHLITSRAILFHCGSLAQVLRTRLIHEIYIFRMKKWIKQFLKETCFSWKSGKEDSVNGSTATERLLYSCCTLTIQLLHAFCTAVARILCSCFMLVIQLLHACCTAALLLYICCTLAVHLLHLLAVQLLTLAVQLLHACSKS